MDLGSAVSHAVDGLVHHDGGVRLLHDLVDLVASGTDQKRHHPLRNKNDHREGLSLDFFETVVDVSQHSLRTLVLALHIRVEDLGEGEVPVWVVEYLDVAPVQVRDSQIAVESDLLD